MTTSANYRRAFDHFEPEHSLDPSETRRLRGSLEQIDYMAFAANEGALHIGIGKVGLASMRSLAISAANARLLWLGSALQLAAAGKALDREQIASLTDRRLAFEELRAAYEGMRRTIERGYVTYTATHES